MTLTGKAKEQFEHYLSGVFKRGYSSWSRLSDFYSLPDSMQWGMYQDFADSVGFIVNVYCNASGYLYEIHRNSNYGGTHLHDSGYEADTESGAWYTVESSREAAIKKLDEILNK